MGTPAFSRLTVYNNFPNEKELFAACQGHFFAAAPDPTPAFAIADPAERLRRPQWALRLGPRRNGS